MDNPATNGISPNISMSSHPCLPAKLSQLRDHNASPRDVKALVHEISLILATEVLSKVLGTHQEGEGTTTMGTTFPVFECRPNRVALVPILRSGLGMVDAFQAILPVMAPVHHLGLFRERASLSPVEYYNNLPTETTGAFDLAIVIDPVIATGATAVAAIQILKEWGAGVPKIIVVSILGTYEGVKKAAEEDGNVQVYVGALDAEVGSEGMILPGLGDIGDRLFLTAGK